MKKVILAVASIALWASCIEDEKDYSQIIETRVARGVYHLCHLRRRYPGNG